MRSRNINSGGRRPSIGAVAAGRHLLPDLEVEPLAPFELPGAPAANDHLEGVRAGRHVGVQGADCRAIE
jgi:hypothetical protein